MFSGFCCIVHSSLLVYDLAALLIWSLVLLKFVLLYRGEWNKPERVLGLDDVNVQAAYASGVVSSAIGDDGSLWVWGRSKRGQLGLGKGVTKAVVPTKVEALLGHEINKVELCNSVTLYLLF